MTTRESGSKVKSTRPRGPRAGGRGRFIPKRKVCFYCANKNEVIDYKNVDKLRTYISDRAKIDPRRRSGTCAKHQRQIATAIKRARHLALLPFVPDHYFPMPAMMAPRSQPAPQPVAPAAPAPVEVIAPVEAVAAVENEASAAPEVVEAPEAAAAESEKENQ